jgi:septation ring formation regulator EzrA
MKQFELSTATFYVQMSLFPETDQQRNAREIAELRISCDKLRKSLHAKNGGLAKAYSELRNELDLLKRDICRHQKITESQGAFL